jgi:hypothetical protein
MSEDEEPDRLPELAMPSEAVRREIEQAQQFFRDNEPMIRQVQEAQRLFREHEPLIRQIQPVIQAHAALWQQIQPMVQAAQWFARDAQWAQIGGGAVGLPFSLRVAMTVDAGIHELVPVARDVAVVGVPGTISVEAATGEVTGTGSVAPPPMRAVGQGTVEKRPAGLAALSDGEIVFLVLVWLYAFVLPWFGAALPPEIHAMLSDSYATFALALAITWRILDKHR